MSRPMVDVENATSPCAVYRLWDEAGRLLYVGSSWDPRSRVGDHRRSQSWGKAIATSTEEWHPSSALAEDAETRAIESESPVHNKRDKPGWRWQRYEGPRLPPAHLQVPIGKEWHRVQDRLAHGLDPYPPEPMAHAQGPHC